MANLEGRMKAVEDGMQGIREDIFNLKTQAAVSGEQHNTVIDKLKGIDDHIKETRSDNKWTFRLLVTAVFGIGITIATVFLKQGIPGAT